MMTDSMLFFFNLDKLAEEGLIVTHKKEVG